MDWLDYRQKLGIGFYDDDKLEHFKIGILNKFGYINSLEERFLTSKEYYNFCIMTGTIMEYDIAECMLFEEVIQQIKRHGDCMEDFLSYCVALVNCIEEENGRVFSKNVLSRMLTESLADAHIPYEIMNDGEKIFVFPKGAKELDFSFVMEPLDWLARYPNARKAFIKALKLYNDPRENISSEIADGFRKALESFMQEFFNSEKSLENLKGEYGRLLKEKGIPKEITSNLETILQAYTNYNNNYAKHRDKTSEIVLEYILYQTGNIIRLVINISESSNDCLRDQEP